MKKVTKRLQGIEWHRMKNELCLVKYIRNDNSHVKGFYKDKDGNVYSHWLNDDEIEALSD